MKICGQCSFLAKHDQTDGVIVTYIIFIIIDTVTAMKISPY